MANGDIAAAAGLPVVAPTADIRLGYDEINLTRDEVATHMTTGTHTWDKVTGKPATFPPAAHDHGNTVVKSYVGQDLRLRYDAGRPLWYVDGTEFGLATEGQVQGKVNTYGGSVTTAANANGPGWDAYNRNVGSGYYATYMDAAMNFGRNVSSRRYKSAIAPADLDVADVLALEPVTFHRNSEADTPDSRDVGLIAEDCTKVPGLVIYDVARTKTGVPVKGARPRPEAVRYETVLPVALLAVVKAQAAQITDLTTRIETLEGKV